MPCARAPLSAPSLPGDSHPGLPAPGVRAVCASAPVRRMRPGCSGLPARRRSPARDTPAAARVEIPGAGDTSERRGAWTRGSSKQDHRRRIPVPGAAERFRLDPRDDAPAARHQYFLPGTAGTRAHSGAPAMPPVCFVGAAVLQCAGLRRGIRVPLPCERRFRLPVRPLRERRGQR